MILGIDPGVSGALCLVDPKTKKIVALVDMPTVVVTINKKNRNVIAAPLIAEAIKRLNPSKAILEKVGVRPGEGALGAFTFGRGVGQLEGVLAALGVPTESVMPATWKRKLDVPADKGGARLKAMTMFPDHAAEFKRVKDDGRAESALIAYYGILAADFGSNIR